MRASVNISDVSHAIILSGYTEGVMHLYVWQAFMTSMPRNNFSAWLIWYMNMGYCSALEEQRRARL